MEQANITIGGMSCGHCVAQVTNALRSIDGVLVQEVKVGSATVSYDPNAVAADDVVRAVERQGYRARVTGPV